MTAVEWIAEKVRHNPLMSSSDYNKLLEEAKEMEKEQIQMAHYNGSVITISKPDDDMLKLAEQYYNETFKSE